MTAMTASAITAETVRILSVIDLRQPAFTSLGDVTIRTLEHIAATGLFRTRPDPAGRRATYDAIDAAHLVAEKIGLLVYDDDGVLSPEWLVNVRDSIRRHADAAWSSVLQDPDAYDLIPETATQARFAHRRYHKRG